MFARQGDHSQLAARLDCRLGSEAAATLAVEPEFRLPARSTVPLAADLAAELNVQLPAELAAQLVVQLAVELAVQLAAELAVQVAA